MQKTLYIVAGANGSGKTTFAKSFADLENIKFINADEIAKLYDPNDMQKHKVKAGREFFRELGDSLQKDDSFIIETTLSGKYIVDVIKKAKDLGFYVSLIYIFLETESENIYRVKNRVLQGGHSVPVDDIVRRYYRSAKLFIDIYKETVDEWILYFNGDDNFEIVANKNEIFDEELYGLFIERVSP